MPPVLLKKGCRIAQSLPRGVNFGSELEEAVRHAWVKNVAVRYVRRLQVRSEGLGVVAQRIQRCCRQQDRRQAVIVTAERTEAWISPVCVITQVVCAVERRCSSAGANPVRRSR